MPATTIEAVMQMRRGLENDLDISQLRIGEWALSTDKKWVRICYAEGKVIKIASQEAMDETLAEIQEIEDAILVMKNAAAASATSASGSATAADESAEDAEAWAVGKRGGVDVPSTDPAYNNNSKYWAEHTSSSLAGLSDTDISNPSNNDVLKYNSTSGKWENGVGGGSGSGGHTILDRIKTALTQRTNLWFKDAKVTDVSADDATAIEVLQSVTESAFDALPTDGTADGLYELSDGDLTPIMAENVGYDNTTSGSSATDLQDAVDDLYSNTLALAGNLPTYNGNQMQLKISAFEIDIKKYATDYGGSLASGFGGQYIVLPLASLQSAGILTGFTKILSVNIVYWAGTWRSNYPNGRTLIDSGGTAIDIILGTNFVGASCLLGISVIGY